MRVRVLPMAVFYRWTSACAGLDDGGVLRVDQCVCGP